MSNSLKRLLEICVSVVEFSIVIVVLVKVHDKVEEELLVFVLFE